jgi:hypothetical protein
MCTAVEAPAGAPKVEQLSPSGFKLPAAAARSAGTAALPAAGESESYSARADSVSLPGLCQPRCLS